LFQKTRTPSRIIQPIKHSRNTKNAKKNPRNDREKKKTLKIVLTKHVDRKGNFTFLKKVSRSNQDKRD
jgi:hypothetical protein